MSAIQNSFGKLGAVSGFWLFKLEVKIKRRREKTEMSPSGSGVVAPFRYEIAG